MVIKRSLFTTPRVPWQWKEGRKEIYYLMMHSTHFIYGYMASDIRQSITQIAIGETCCLHMGYSLRLIARVLLYAPSHRQDNTYHGLCYTSRGALAGTRTLNRCIIISPLYEFLGEDLVSVGEQDVEHAMADLHRGTQDNRHVL